MKEDLYDDLYLEEKEEKTDFKAILFKYAIHWPWFVACTLLCIAGAWLYLRYTPPVYNISASVIIKDNDKNSKASSGMGDLEDLGFYSSINNFDNEVEILQSRTLIKKVVEELDLYISYATKSSFHDIELYKSSPVKYGLPPKKPRNCPPRASSPDLAAGQQAECETPDRRRGIQQAVRQAARLADHPVGHVQLYP